MVNQKELKILRIMGLCSFPGVHLTCLVYIFFCLFLLQEHVTFAVESKGHGTRTHFKEPENTEKLTLHIVYKFEAQKQIR